MTYIFSTTHGFSKDDLSAIIKGVNTTLNKLDAFRLVSLEITSDLLTAKSLSDACDTINAWVKPLNPSQAWSQHFSDKQVFPNKQSFPDDLLVYKTPPLHAELLCGDKKSALIKHIGGFEWRLVTISENESDGKMVAAQDFSLMSTAPNTTHLNYTQYWDGKDGALIPFMERFTGFTLAGEK